MTQSLLAPDSASELLDEQARHTSPTVGMSPVFRPNIPSTIPRDLRDVIAIHRSLLREVIQQSKRTGMERAVSICGPDQPVASNVQNGDADSVAVPPCGTGSLAVAVHTHPDALQNPALSLRDIQASIRRDFDYVIALGTQSMEVVRKPTVEEMDALREAGLQKGLKIIQQGRLTQEDVKTLRSIHKRLRDTGPFGRYNTGFLDVSAPHRVAERRPARPDGGSSRVDIGFPQITLFPTNQTISLGDKVIDAVLSAFVTVVLFRVVFGGSPQELVSGVVSEIAGPMKHPTRQR